MTNSIMEIPISQIIPPHSMLRPVREECLEFLELVDSIRAHGIMNSLLVRPHPHREGIYEIIDGMWRFKACKELHISTLPCIIITENLTEEEFLSIQIQTNAISYETRPIEFAEQLSRMLQLRESVGAPMTLTELAKAVSKSSGWVSSRLKLLKLCNVAKDMIRSGKLHLGKGVILARINNHNYQLEFLEKATSMTTREFEIEVGNFIAYKMADRADARLEERSQVAFVPRLQSMDSMLIELDRLQNIGQIIVQKGLTTALEGARITLEWVLNLHDEGRQAQLKELRHKLSFKDRQDIIGRRRYEELKEMRELEEEKRDLYFQSNETKGTHDE